MFSKAINEIRTFGYKMKNPLPRKIFFLHKFAPKRYSAFKDVMYTLNTQVHLGTITEENAYQALLEF